MENLDQSNNKNVSLGLVAAYGASDSESDETETPSIENLNESEDNGELSEMVLKNNIINACAHGPLSSNSCREDEETTRHMIIDSNESGVVEYEVTEYRDADSSDSDSSSGSDSSDSDIESVKDIEEISSDENESGNPSKFETPKVRGELGLDDLPPIEDLAISLPSKETIKIGTVSSIVDRLVVVRALPETPAVDLESVLFLDNGARALGKVFDVFGPVTEPHYCVRFNSAEHVTSRGVQPGMDVFIAPQKEHLTSYVFLSQLMKVKGSDASWLHDIEPPPTQVDFSDDEEERKVKKQNKNNKTNEQSESEDNAHGRKILEARRQRPSESSSRFGGPSRGRNPFRRNPTSNPRFGRPFSFDGRPPPIPDFSGPFSAPPFNPAMPPPHTGYQFGSSPRMPAPPMPMGMPFRPNGPVFGTNNCNGAGPQSQWYYGQPTPPGT